MSIQRIQQHFTEAAAVLQQFMGNEQNLLQIAEAATLMSSAIEGGGKIISCGNGGSHCDAMHFA